MQFRKRTTIILVTIAFLLGSLLTTAVALILVNRKVEPKTIQELTQVDPALLIYDNLKKTSPNGKYVAFVTTKDISMRESTIWVMNSDGTNLHEVASGYGDYVFVTNPIWSPDSKQIAYVQYYPTQIWVVNRDGSKDRMISNSKQLYIPFGYAGETNLTWTDPNLIQFENSADFPTAKYTVNINNTEIKKISEGEKLTAEIGAVPVVSQHDTNWDGVKLGGCDKKTIGSDGCALASIAMVMKYYGIDADPSTLNTMLNNNLGYMNGCDVRWDMAVNFAQGVKFMAIYHYDVKKERLDYELASGHPVIIGMDKYKHFVVVTKKIGDKYIINDPRFGDDGKVHTLDDYENIMDHMVIYYKD